MNRHHLLHVYTGLRAEIERLSSIVRPAAIGASAAAIGLDLQPQIIADISELILHTESEEIH